MVSKIAVLASVSIITSGFTYCKARSSAELAAADTSTNNAVLIFTLDGLGFDILNSTEDGRSFIKENQVTRLIPPIPAVTFPSHATLIFGLDPEFHGVLRNFSTPQAFAASGKVIDPFKSKVWQQLKSSGTRLQLNAMGELSPFGDVKPLEVETFSEVEDKFAAAQVAAPRLVSKQNLISVSWNEGTDKAGHASGPNSEEVSTRLSNLLPQLRRIKDKALKPNAFPYNHTTVIFASDHGMAELKNCVPYFSKRDSDDYSHGASYVLLKTETAVKTARAFVERLPASTIKLYRNPDLAIKGVLLLPEGYRFDNAGSRCEILAKGNHEFDPNRYPSQHGIFWVWNPKDDRPHPSQNIEVMEYVASQLK